jgi:hypothetical protein
MSRRRIPHVGAFGLLDGLDAAPAKMLDDAGKKVSMLNLDYDIWVVRDQFVQGWLHKSISLDILAHVLNTETIAKTWATFFTMFKSTSKAKASHLRTALLNTKMTGFRSELAAVGKIIDDEEMIGYITAGLDNTYNALVDKVDVYHSLI